MGTHDLARELRRRVAIVRALLEIAPDPQVDEEWARLVPVLLEFVRTCASPQELRLAPVRCS